MALHDGTGRMTVAPATGTPARGGVAVAARPARLADPGQVPLRPPVAAPRPWRLTGRPALYLLASLIVALLAASAAPTPLYAIYQARWHFTPITTTSCSGSTRWRCSLHC